MSAIKFAPGDKIFYAEMLDYYEEVHVTSAIVMAIYKSGKLKVRFKNGVTATVKPSECRKSKAGIKRLVYNWAKKMERKIRQQAEDIVADMWDGVNKTIEKGT